MGVELKLQPANPPKPLADRKAWIIPGKRLNTLVIPHDPKDSNATRWACTQNDPSSLAAPKQRPGNEVVYLVDGKETFQQFQCEMEKTGKPGDCILLIGWQLDIDLVFPDAVSADGKTHQPGRSMRDLLVEKAELGVKIRVMLDGEIHSQAENEAAVNVLYYARDRHELDCDGVVDDRYKGITGSHHQKLLIVKHGDQLTAFCGGVDIGPDRIKGDAPGRPIHDVHCRIRGPAAADLLKIFTDRWNDYVAQKRVCSSLDLDTPEPKSTGPFSVQVCRTFGQVSPPFRFAPQGERSIKNLLEKAIEASQRFIYIEDQYLTDLLMANWLRFQLPKLRHLTIVLPAPDVYEWPMQEDCRRFIEVIRNDAGQRHKVRVFCRNGYTHTCGNYIHAKTWIFDDQFAVIGSANCDHRGYYNDSEVAAGIYDASNDERLTYTFAHRLRIKLWAHHLNIDNLDGHAELADGVASANHWYRFKEAVSEFHPPHSRVVNTVDQAGDIWIDP